MTIDAERQFRDRLEHMATWCVSRVDPRNVRWCLRSAELRPVEANPDESDPYVFNDREIIETVVRTRVLTMARAPRIPVHQIAGRLLWCEYDATLADGLSDHYSQGFFDSADNTPWDTWIDVVDDALISWVPSAFVNLANEGILSEAFGMIDWVVNRNAVLPSWLLRIAREMDERGAATWPGRR